MAPFRKKNRNIDELGFKDCKPEVQTIAHKQQLPSSTTTTTSKSTSLTELQSPPPPTEKSRHVSQDELGELLVQVYGIIQEWNSKVGHSNVPPGVILNQLNTLGHAYTEATSAQTQKY